MLAPGRMSPQRFLVISAMVEDEHAVAEEWELLGVLDRGRRVDDLRISRRLTDRTVGARGGTEHHRAIK